MIAFCQLVRLVFALTRPMYAIAVALSIPAIAAASMTIVTLPGLVEESPVIAYGHVKSNSNSTQSEHPPPVVTFEVLEGIKGDAAVRKSRINLCNSRINSEWPDLSKKTSELVVFVSPKGSCFELSHGWKSAIVVSNGRAQTYMLEKEPHDQALETFIHKIRSLATEQDH